MPKLAPTTQPNEPVPEGRYRIATVAELTGIPEPTLRAWERRYGVPTPERTPSGYRLYRDRDIRIVREMRRLCGEGLAAAEAARLLRADDVNVGEASRVRRTKGGFALATAEIIEAAKRFDDVALRRAAHRALSLGTATRVVERVFLPVLRAMAKRGAKR